MSNKQVYFGSRKTAQSASLAVEYMGRVVWDGNRLRQQDIVTDRAVIHFKDGKVSNLHGGPAVEALDGSGQVEYWRDSYPENPHGLPAIFRLNGSDYKEYWRERVMITGKEGS
jgi:hypothetical protein